MNPCLKGFLVLVPDAADTVIAVENFDITIVLTDEITEATNLNNEDFTKDRIIEIVKNNAELSSREIGQKIMAKLESFTEGTTIDDDITLIVLKRNNSRNFIEGI